MHMYYICALSLVNIATGSAPFSSIVYDDLPIIWMVVYRFTYIGMGQKLLLPFFGGRINGFNYH